MPYTVKHSAYQIYCMQWIMPNILLCKVIHFSELWLISSLLLVWRIAYVITETGLITKWFFIKFPVYNSFGGAYAYVHILPTAEGHPSHAPYWDFVCCVSSFHEKYVFNLVYLKLKLRRSEIEPTQGTVWGGGISIWLCNENKL